jgi:cation transport regulator ChaC
LNGSARLVATATTVEDHVLVFNVFSDSNKCGAASITQGGDAPVWGRLYDIPEDLVVREKKRAGRRTLDEIEGEGTHYTRTRVAVVRSDTGQHLTAVTYVAKTPSGPYRPSRGYLNHIVTGLQECGAPEEYVEKVRAVPTLGGA